MRHSHQEEEQKHEDTKLRNFSDVELDTFRLLLTPSCGSAWVGYGVYTNLEDLLLRSATEVEITEQFEAVADFHEEDSKPEDLKSQLAILGTCFSGDDLGPVLCP